MTHLDIHILAPLALALLAGAVSAGEKLRDYPIRPVPFTAVQIDDRFWSPRVDTNRRVTIPYDFAKCEETGRIDNFAKAGGLIDGDFQGIEYDDSDVFKVIEGAAYSLAQQPDPELEAYLDDLIAKIAAAQEPDGYLYTFRTIHPGEPGRFAGEQRWSNLRSSHELYNVGHMYEAAVTHHRATGKRTLLDVALRSADLIAREFGPDGRRDPPGHQEIEIGLVRLFRLTGERRYLDLAKFFLDQRGRDEGRELYGPYAQDHLPVAEQREPAGHAVRAGYMYSGMADVAALTGDAEYLRALGAIWEEVAGRKMYVTGGIGSRRAGEAFGDAYELPNDTAYNETCAAIAHALWNHRMFLLHGDAKYLDVLERTIYNAFLAGVSLSGDRFFYPNVLAHDGHTPFNHGSAQRSAWFTTSCCPVNVVRFIPSLGGYVYARRDESIYVNLFVGGRGEVELPGNTVTLTQETSYPWSGDVRIAVDPEGGAEFPIHVRIPGWARGEPAPGGLYRYLDEEAGPAPVTLKINGEPITPRIDSGFARIERAWKAGDVIELALPMPIRRVVADERVEANRGRVALERGPIVYCVEAADHEGDAWDLALPDEAKLAAEHRGDLLGGVTILTGDAVRVRRGDEGTVETEPVRITAVPYHVWAHRDVGSMAVWLPRDPEIARPRPAPTIASASRPGASHVWHTDTVHALNDQIEPEDSADHSIARFTWWDRRGTTEWVQYEFERPERVSAVEVYWFDDTGVGQCRPPAEWRLLYRDGERWRPVANPSGYATELDRFNTVTFDAVETDALRIEAVLQPDLSAGILEWRVR